MIDVESQVFDYVAKRLKSAFPGIVVTGEYVKAPSSFPCVSLIEMDNSQYRATQSSSSNENHASLMYEMNVYSNKARRKKSECKEIAAVADDAMATLGFTRTMLNPVPNLNDATIHRIVGRYTAIVSRDEVIFRTR